VRSYRSRDLRRWEPGPRAIVELPQWARRYVKDDRLWAPDVIRAGDGRYFLYYSASSWGKNTSAIGLASNATLDPADPNFRWVDEGIVIASTPADDFNAIDPAVTFAADGTMWLSFGSFWSGIKLIELNPRSGKRIASDSPIHALAHQKEIEAPFIHRRGDAYYLLVNWGLCCRGVKSTYNIRVGRSDRITGPYRDKDGKDLRDGGGSLLLGSEGSMIGPGHPGIAGDGKRNWLSFHFYDATQNGRGTLGIRAITWDSNGWPVIEDRP
jgi:arabinan endo-1,5-alpha-L-arabinosidase